MGGKKKYVSTKETRGHVRTRVNAELLRRVADRIEEDPFSFDMRHMQRIRFDDGSHTGMCVIGHTLEASGARTGSIENEVRAASLLNLDPWDTEFFWVREPLDEHQVPEMSRGLYDEKLMSTADLNRYRRYVPDALRYMADTSDMSWTRALRHSKRVWDEEMSQPIAETAQGELA